MAAFVEFKEYKGEKVLVNIEHIIKVRPENEGTYIFFDAATGSQDSTSLSVLHVEDSYATVKRILQR